MPAVSKAKLKEIAEAKESEVAALRQRAARQAAANLDKPEAIPVATYRVLPMGDGKISMGVHVAGVGDAHLEKGETESTALPIAQELEAKGYVEITGIVEPDA